MALRNIREFGDPVLNKVCLPIKEMTDRNRELINDMFETMYEANGVGLAAPQVGVLKRVFVIDVTGEDPLVFINPEITEASGTQTGYEGCLSLPGKTGTVTRPQKVRAKALDIDMKPFEIEQELKQLEQVNERLVSIIAERTGKNVKQVSKVTMSDSYFNAEEAIEFGLASKVIDSDCLRDLMKRTMV